MLYTIVDMYCVCIYNVYIFVLVDITCICCVYYIHIHTQRENLCIHIKVVKSIFDNRHLFGIQTHIHCVVIIWLMNKSALYWILIIHIKWCMCVRVRVYIYMRVWDYDCFVCAHWLKVNISFGMSRSQNLFWTWQTFSMNFM